MKDKYLIRVALLFQLIIQNNVKLSELLKITWRNLVFRPRIHEENYVFEKLYEGYFIYGIQLGEDP